VDGRDEIKALGWLGFMVYADAMEDKKIMSERDDSFSF
jgi:hypothetical protein